MANNWSLCSGCDNSQLTKPSAVWCSECDESLCTDCNKYHRVSKGTNNHATISIGVYEKIQTEVLRIAQVCKKHNGKYELFCRKHDCPCCKYCLKYHKDCKGITDINEVIQNVKTSNAFYEIEQSLMEAVLNIKGIRTNREDNLTSLANKKREIEEKIKETRAKINNYLDILQYELMNELMATEQEESSKIREVLTILRQKEQKIAKYQTNVAYIKQYASEMQIFLSMKHIEKDMAFEEKFIQSLIESDTTDQVNISCRINESLQEIAAIVEKFGDINVSSDPCDLAIQKRKDRQAQIMLALPTRTIDNLTLTLQKRINTGLSEVRGCSMLPDGRMVFSCYHQNKVKVLNSDRSTYFEMNKIGYTFDVVFIGNDSIAVTSAESDQINIINFKKHNLEKSIKVNPGNYGIVYKDGNLIYCSRNKGLKMISLSKVTIAKDVYHRELPPSAYVTAFADKLFFTNGNKNSVTCCDYHGNTLWSFRNTSVLRDPLGISADNYGNVFVVGYSSKNVVVISPNGKRYRQLLSHADGLIMPTVLQYDQSTNTLIVATSIGDAFVYQVE
ncbi:unnamed protein product [Mytilus coruscus]|uniref:B box-type domain-containing protein n=1 Tax=Mytilus coruscus TaxID=42192 RepID=A0A6J8B8T8_MYTCO|nr:unnamed protein product [Mytilus coruscus]